jgi:hypothetical protein
VIGVARVEEICSLIGYEAFVLAGGERHRAQDILSSRRHAVTSDNVIFAPA